ncbi:MAG TPA: GTPase [Gaiellaceae bacterium]|nr:GTPase [Gaiellaceae bacterium]
MSGLDERLAALARAAEIADGRLDADAVAAARRTVEKAGRRLGLGVEATVVALAGPTGAGKSTLFNGLAGSDLSDTGRRRPTTAAAAAAVWGDGGDELLDWLDVRRRHRLAPGDLDGLVLLDLPDFDSVELGHRLEVDRLVELVDLVLWVTDPQKYADAAWHERYLRPLAAHAGAMAVVLNHADTLEERALDACVADLRSLLARELDEPVPVLPASARTGAGLESVTALLAERVAARAAAAARLEADVTTAAGAFAAAAGSPRRARVEGRDRDELVAALADAAGLQAVTRAVATAHRRRGALAAGWPFVRWVRRVRPDPLRRLRLPEQPQELVRTSLPAASAAQLARAETAARRLADRAAEGLPDPWPRLVRAAATAAPPERVADRLDRAVAGADLHVSRPRWWRLAGVLQMLLAAAAALGLLWLLALALAAYFRLDAVVPTPEVRGVEVPTALALGGLLAGILLSFLARLVNGAGARRRARAAARSVRARVAEAADELVVAPVEGELAAHDALAEAVAAARGEARRRRRPFAPREPAAAVPAAARGEP